MGRRAGWSRAALVALVVSIPGASGFGISGVSPLGGMTKAGVTGMGLRAGALPGGRAASAGGLPGQRSGRGAATIRAAFVPDKENMDLTNSQPDHPILKDPCYIKDRMTGEQVISRSSCSHVNAAATANTTTSSWIYTAYPWGIVIMFPQTYPLQCVLGLQSISIHLSLSLLSLYLDASHAISRSSCPPPHV